MEEDKKTEPSVDTERWPRPPDAVLHALLDEDRKNYESGEDPLSLISAFATAYRYDLPIPEWVLENLFDKFLEYNRHDGKKSLEHIFGFRGKRGPGATPFSRREIRKRDMFIMSVIHGWKSCYGLSIADAAEVACVQMEECFPRNPAWYISNPEQLRKNFSTKKWGREFKHDNPLGRAMVSSLDNNQFDRIIAALRKLHRPDIVEKLKSRRPTLKFATTEKGSYRPLIP
ncbi:MAG: hypothetical protein A4E60_02595 [Syntrophorhabdus sp. PtaB.Bin047]|jgi:hypothetical protein|nr:MAG: hypothetical protein A4E60_02595 [Syntrophorhabdus sp. PtaB.Bin047]OPY76505.1 MAG: hypothetical protein A4E63_00076 [Syntrophorhabdus sp. PtaU1.Bin050]